MVEPRPLLSVTPSPTSTRFSDLEEGIRVTQTFTIEESNEAVSIRPPDTDYWAGYLLPAELLQPDSTITRLISILPCIHVVMRTCAEAYLVAVAYPRAASLCGIGIPLQYALGSSDPWEPNEDDIRTHGAVEARRRFHTAISDSAAEAAASGCPKGLLRYFRKHAEPKCLVRMEWAELIRDIEEAPDRVTDRFAALCRYLGLRRLECEDSLSTESVEALLQRKPNDWVEQLHRATAGLCAPLLSGQDLAWSGHVRSMLREVVEIAGGPESSSHRGIDRDRSANENLAAVGIVFGLDTRPGPLSMNGSDAKHARGLVLQELKQVAAEDEDDFRKLMRMIGFPIDAYPSLPAGLPDSRLPIKAIADYTRPRLRHIRKTSVTGSPVEQLAFRRLLHFLPQEQFRNVRVTGEQLSILARYSWGIPVPLPPTAPPPKEEILNALESRALREECYSHMVGAYSFGTVEKAIDQLLQQLAGLESRAGGAMEPVLHGLGR